MGRHKFNAGREGWTAEPDASARAKPDMGAHGEGVLDIVKDFTKRAGKKTANKLAEKVGRKIGKEIISIARTKPSTMKENESAGDRIKEILEANSITRMGLRPAESQPALRSGLWPTPTARPTVSQRRRDATQKVNETVSRLHADDD